MEALAVEQSWSFTPDEEVAPRRHVVGLLGGGHEFEAYLAWDSHLYALVVVKLPRPHKLHDDHVRRAMAREAEALSLLAHPLLPRLFAADLEADRPYLVLEQLDGPRLSTTLRRYRVVVEQAIPLGLQLCSALHYLGEEGWVHLDVKPKNVILGSPVRLIDLGIARRIDDAQRLSSPLGTDAYMAPEQCDPAPLTGVGPAADVWGLGVTLYEALSRSRPFPEPGAGASTLAERYPQTAVEPMPLRADVPAPLAELVMACLARHADDRPTPAQLAEALEPIDASLPRPRLGRFRPS